jgi:hypothetical protein
MRLTHFRRYAMNRPVSQIAHVLLCVAVIASISVVGCDNPPANRPATAADARTGSGTMYDLVTQAMVDYIIRHVDRPFDIKVGTNAIVDIDSDTPGTIVGAIECSLKENGIQVSKLFFLTFENKVAPARATTKDDLVCLLVNADGKVLWRDEDYWSGIPTDAQPKCGAVDTDGPPFMAKMLLKFKELKEQRRHP